MQRENSKEDKENWKKCKKSKKKLDNDMGFRYNSIWKVRNGFSLLTQMRYIMCRIRCFYEGFDGKLSCSEMIMSYEEDIASFVKHWKTGGRMVITEHYEIG